MNERELWQAILNRSTELDGAFVYGVRSTHVYCRPSCPSRKPDRHNVVFFPVPEVAEQSGFRPCKRCQPDRAVAVDPRVAVTRNMCRYIEEHVTEPLTLLRLSHEFNLSPYHLQRTFKQVVGISPQQYATACRVGRVQAALQEGNGISDAVYAAGFASISGLYRRSDAELGMTPRTYQLGGQDMRIRYTVVPCRLGQLLVAATQQGVCRVKIGDSPEEVEQLLLAEFGQATVVRDDAALKDWVEAILHHLDGQDPHLALPLDIQATAFQRRVWQALQDIPYGETRTYAEIAATIGQPAAVRAVAHACATNPAAVVVPCHRVVRKDGGLGGYRWGLARKLALLQQEHLVAQALDGSEG